jgi:nitrite reductase/ring-hydroxylating ferredoxin subunit
MHGSIEEIPGQGMCIRCPWHGWKFSLNKGRCIIPNRGDVVAKIFPVKVDCENGHKVSVGFPEIDPAIFKQLPP